MYQNPFSIIICIMFDLLIWLFPCNTFAQSSTKDYIKQDVFYIGLENGCILQPDTIVKQGLLSDGTRFFIYPISNQKNESMTIHRAEKENGERALIVAGKVNIALMIDSLEALVKTPERIFSVPLYTDANILCPNKTKLYGRIDLRYQLKPYMTSELRQAGFSLQHSALVNLVATHINNSFIKLKVEGKMPSGVNDVYCLNTAFLSGNDIENLCIYVETKPGLRHEAIKAVKECLKQIAQEGISETLLNHAKQIYLEQYNNLNRIMTYDENIECLMQHTHIKRIADAYMLGNPLCESEEESKKLINNVVTVNSEFITEVLRKTIEE